jgi:hypothetical protein
MKNWFLKICFQILQLVPLSRGSLLVIATPFGIGFDHLRIADEAQFRFDRCIRTLSDEVEGLPVFGVGHSMVGLCTS